MKYIFSFLLALFLSVAPIVGKAQTDGVPQSTYAAWQCANQGQYGSFWWMIERTDYVYNGNYYYYVYMSSNSYLASNGTNYKAVTYIDHPTVTMTYGSGQYTYPYTLTSAMFDWEKTKIFVFYTIDPYASFHLNWLRVYPFDYSSK